MHVWLTLKNKPYQSKLLDNVRSMEVHQGIQMLLSGIDADKGDRQTCVFGGMENLVPNLF